MTSISYVEHDEDVEPFDTNLWAQQLNFQWEKRFEQHEPPTKDKVIQVNVSDQTSPKLIFISKSLSPEEKRDLISFIQEYIDVFALSYEDIPGLNSQAAMHRLNTKPDTKPVKQQQW